MNRIIIFLSATALVFVTAASINADLVPQGNGTLYDNVNEMYWFKDLNSFAKLTYDEQLTMITNIGYGFHLATYEEMYDLFFEYTAPQLGAAFDVSGPDWTEGAYSYHIWQGRYESVPDTPSGYHYTGYFRQRIEDPDWWQWGTVGDLESGKMNDTNWQYDMGAWVTSESPIPVPTTLLLFGSGLIGIVGIRRKIKK
jgi:hypothetical protein